MSNMDTHKAAPEGAKWINAYLSVRDAEAAIAFYQKAFGCTIREVVPGEDGKPMHVELMYKDTVLMLGPECQEFPSPLTIGGTGLVLYTYTEDVDGLCLQAQAAGAKIVKEPKDEFWGDRCCLLEDPDGHKWMFATRLNTH